MPLGLPDLAWSTWLLVAAGGFVLAWLVPKLAPDGSRSSGIIVFIIICLASVCGVIGALKWFGEQ
jgi:hypothetical protein